MISTIRGFASFGRPAQVLFVNQAGINIGFYMIMPYLAGHLTGAGLAVWLVGLLLGVDFQAVSLAAAAVFAVG